MSIKLNTKLPEFTLIDQEGATFNSEAELEGAPCVIYFYPKNFTPGCTAEACSFRDAYQDFIEHNVKVVGISADTEASHKKFAKKYNLPFTLLADENKKVRELFKVQSKLLGLLPGRETFVFDKSGLLLYKFDGITAGKHITNALEIIKSLDNG